MSDINKLRQRWLRWLGQKTRHDKPYWITLLDSNWVNWASGVLEKHKSNCVSFSGIQLPTISNLSSYPREEVKQYYLEAIKCADLQDFLRLDELYCNDKIEKRGW